MLEYPHTVSRFLHSNASNLHETADGGKASELADWFCDLCKLQILGRFFAATVPSLSTQSPHSAAPWTSPYPFSVELFDPWKGFW
jgi:hypothetical protein